MAFTYALKAQINQGICISVESIGTIYVLIASYLIFKERIKALQLIGILTVLVSVSIVALFSYESEGMHGPSKTIQEEVDESSKSFYLLITFTAGLIAGVSFGHMLLV